VVGRGKDRVHCRLPEPGLDTPTVDRLAREGLRDMVKVTTQDHLAFVARIAAVLEGREKLEAAQLSTHHTCRLGRWYDGVNDEVVLALPSYRSLLEPHRAVHEAGHAVLRAHQAGDAAGAKRHMAALEEASRTVCAILAQIGQDLEAPALAA
jgi:hypothetical protein